MIWPDDALRAPSLAATPTEPAALSPRLSALLLFDDDAAGRAASRPDATILQASIPAPADGRRVALLALGESHLGDAPVALNGLDFEWYERDHRLGQLSVVADRSGGEAGPGR